MDNLTNLKVVQVSDESIQFDNGYTLESNHERDCCEHHYLDFKSTELNDYDGLEFNLSNDDFLEKIEHYGIRLKPTKGLSVPVPGYGENNGYYSNNIDLVLKDSKGTTIKTWDVTKCQEEESY